MLPLVREQLNLFIGGVVENDVTTTKGEVPFRTLQRRTGEVISLAAS
jgi:hypothetical protein